MTDHASSGDPKRGNGASDIATTSWIDRRAPAALRPYARLARLDRPIGTWLLLLPCWWGLCLATASSTDAIWPNPYHAALFALGALVMRGAGCTWNDILDRDIDGKVARTAERPIASGAVSVRQALLFLVLQLSVGLVILLQFSLFTVAVACLSLALVALYPLMKRVTYWPQVWLGLTFNWGAFVGWSAVAGSIGAPALWLYAAGILWTVGYDTIYAHQDKEDDILVGVKSSALKLGDRTRPWLLVFYAGSAACLVGAGWSAGLSWPYFAILALAALHLLWQALTADFDRPEDCLSKFRSNRDFGLIVVCAMLVG